MSVKHGHHVLILWISYNQQLCDFMDVIMLRISCKERTTNEEVLKRVQSGRMMLEGIM